VPTKGSVLEQQDTDALAGPDCKTAPRRPIFRDTGNAMPGLTMSPPSSLLRRHGSIATG